MTQAEAEARDLSRLATDELSALPRGIGDVHAAIADRVFGVLGPPAAPVRFVHDTISRGVYTGVSGGLRVATSVATRHTPARWRCPRRRAARWSSRRSTGSTATGWRLRAARWRSRCSCAGWARPSPHVVVFVHGLGESEYAWGSPSYGERLQEELGLTPVFVRYNTGRHISQNGASLAALLDRLDAERITLVGHSMGGLVARAACHRGGEWTSKVRLTVSLGTPHAGAPLEQAVHTMSAALHLAPETRPFARFLRRRSAGIRDLRRGSLVDEDWSGRDPDALRAKALGEVPLLPNATHAFVAATVTRSHKHPLGRLLGDTLVLSPSASGRRLGLEHGLALGGTHHLALLNHPEVYTQLCAWLAQSDASTSCP